jgi:hypothetical protein
LDAEEKTITKCVNGVFQQVKSPPKKDIKIMSAKELQQAEFPEIEWLIDNLIPKGALYILSGKSKVGKSFAVLDMCCSVANGMPFLSMRTHKSGVLYLDLEENPIMLQARLDKQLGQAQAPENLYVVNEFTTMNDTFIEDITGILEGHKDIALIVVDVYQKIKKVKPANVSDYEDVYSNFAPLKELTQKYGVSIILVCHDRKMVDESDPFGNIIGSTAFMGASDGAIAIYKKKRSDEDATMSVIGRMVSQEDYAIRFDKDSLKWRMMGTSADMIEQRRRQEYEKNPIVLTIREGMKKSPQFVCSCKDLIDISKQLGFNIKGSPEKVSRELVRLDDDLSYYDQILVERVMNGTGGGKRSFKKIFT